MTPDELKHAVKALPPMDPVEPGHNWRFWKYDLRQNILNLDPAEFLTWPGVVGTMFVGNAPYTATELIVVEDLFGTALVEETNVGHPETMEYGEHTISGNLVHQAYHMAQLMDKTGLYIDELETIVEIGGGYGAMALICNRLGFEGRYIIYDLDEFSLLQQYYLSNVGVNNVEFKTQIEKPIEADLLIGLYSLSEMPLTIRDTVIDLCPSDNYLIVYQATWGMYDNLCWSARLMSDKPKHIWHNWNVAHLPNSWYMVGSNR